MAFNVKSLPDIVRTAENALSASFRGVSAVIAKSVLKTLAAAFGGLMYMFSLVCKSIFKNRFVSTCDIDCLDGFGAEYGLPHRAPVYASGRVFVRVTGGTVTVHQGTVLINRSSGLEYEVGLTTTLTSSGFVPVVARFFGADSNLDDGVALEFRDGAIAGIDPAVESSVVSGGRVVYVQIEGAPIAWGETADEYRARLLARIQNQPHGGTKEDYKEWCLRFGFVNKVFVKPSYPKTNAVAIALANTNTPGVPLTASQVQEVADYLNNDARRPITADLRVFAATPVNIEITAIISPYNETSKANVENALRKYVESLEPQDSVSFSQINEEIRANANVKSFAVAGIKKNGDDKQNLTLNLNVPADGVTGAIAEVPNVSVVLENGEFV